MAPTLDVFWSFRSPYSYLATPRLVELAATWDVDLRVRVVLPLAVRKPDFFRTVNPLWPPYLLRDTARIAEELNAQYMLGYTPVTPGDGRYRSIRISVRKGLGYTVRARRGVVR